MSTWMSGHWFFQHCPEHYTLSTGLSSSHSASWCHTRNIMHIYGTHRTRWPSPTSPRSKSDTCLPVVGAFDFGQGSYRHSDWSSVMQAHMQQTHYVLWHNPSMAIIKILCDLCTQHPVAGLWFVPPQTTIGKFSPQDLPFQRLSHLAITIWPLP